MPTIRVKSGASGAANGTTWTDAYTTLAAADAVDVAGDTIALSQAHSETTSANVALTFAGTVTSPTRLICANDAADPPTAQATGAVVATGAGAYAITVAGSLYARGVAFRAGVGGTSSNAFILLNNGNTSGIQRYESCDFELAGTGTAAYIATASDTPTVPTQLIWQNCRVKFGATGQRINIHGMVRWTGGSVMAGSSSPTALFYAKNVTGAYRPLDVIIDGVDFSVFANTFALVEGAPVSSGRIILRNCKMPSGWNPSSLFSASITGRPGIRVELYNVDAGDTNYKVYIQDAAGKVTQETTIVRTGGASDGTTTIARKMESSATASYPLIRLESPEMAIWNETTGSAVTVTAEIVHDSQGAGAGGALQDDECWLEVQYLGTSGFSLGSLATDVKSDVLGAASDQTSSSETWTTTGLTTPVKQKISCSITPQEKGFILAKVVLAKASKTVYFDPKLTVS